MNWLIPKAYAAAWNFLQPTAYNTPTEIEDVITKIVNFITIIAAGLAVIYLIYSGIIYITAAGNPDNAKKGQQGVINAIIGIVIIAAAYFIIRVGLGLADKLTTSGFAGFVGY